ncbi:MAG: thioredoxin family protein [Planctomycetota bacterium]
MHDPGGFRTVVKALFGLVVFVDGAIGSTAIAQTGSRTSGPTTIQGRLSIAHSPGHDFSETRVYATGLKGLIADLPPIQASQNGDFEFSVSSPFIAVFVETSDRRFAGHQLLETLASPVTVDLLPTVDYAGRLLNLNGDPIADHLIATQIRLEGPTDRATLTPNQLVIRQIFTKTRADGSFRLQKLPARLPLVVSTNAPNAPEQFHILDRVYLQPNEKRPLTIHKLSDGSPSRAVERPSLQERFRRLLRDARLNEYRLLVVRYGDDTAALQHTQRYLVNPYHLDEIARYLPLLITPESTATTSDTAFLASKDWPLPKPGQVLACVLDGDGTELDRIELKSLGPDAVIASDNFLFSNAPERRNAAQSWEAAFQLARQTQRRVWAVETGRFCESCFQFSRWMDDHGAILQKDYVVFKTEPELDQHGSDIASRFKTGTPLGVPFYAILDDQEQVLIDSEGPVGNIAMPDGYEDRLRLREMLLKTRIRLTDADIDLLLESLSE